MEQPLELTLDILYLRSYATAKGMVERAQRPDELPDHPAIERVWEVLGDIAADAKRSRKVLVDAG